jgi:hypothetical protein
VKPDELVLLRRRGAVPVLDKDPARDVVEVERLRGRLADFRPAPALLRLARRLRLHDRQYARERRFHEVERSEMGGGRLDSNIGLG